MKRFSCLFVFLFLPEAVYSDTYFELSVEEGGETYASAEGPASYSGYDFTRESDVNLGGGLKLAIGAENFIGESEGEDAAKALTYSIGFIRRRLDASNGDASFDVFTVDAIFNWLYRNHQVGIGASLHLNPKFESEIDGFSPVNIKFDDALGLVLQYRYQLFPGFLLGIRLTEMEYEAGSIADDASSIGLFFAYAPKR
ncbi:hypothetical protein [Neptunomonas sp.]|uniref:hypothetical protein n=1 Tax=Neptunomonas sp. TaxID=1971898 RepID=UPI00356944F8